MVAAGRRGAPRRIQRRTRTSWKRAATVGRSARRHRPVRDEQIRRRDRAERQRMRRGVTEATRPPSGPPPAQESPRNCEVLRFTARSTILPGLVSDGQPKGLARRKISPSKVPASCRRKIETLEAAHWPPEIRWPSHRGPASQGDACRGLNDARGSGGARAGRGNENTHTAAATAATRGTPHDPPRSGGAFSE